MELASYVTTDVQILVTQVTNSVHCRFYTRVKKTKPGGGG